MPAQEKLDSRGLLLAFTAYFLWGSFPYYFKLLSAAGPFEIIGHRVLWTFLFCLVGVVVWRQWDHLRQVLADRALFWRLAIAGVLVSTNWTIYVWGVLNDHIVDAALGYFINPLVTVTLAVFVLHERLRTAQKIALGIGTGAVVVIAVGFGQVPWVCALAGGHLRRVRTASRSRWAARCPPLCGLTVETILLAPLALGFLIWLQATGASQLSSPMARD